MSKSFVITLAFIALAAVVGWQQVRIHRIERAMTALHGRP